MIREVLDLKTQGFSLRKIGQELAARGFSPRNGVVWHAASVTYLLRAEVA